MSQPLAFTVTAKNNASKTFEEVGASTEKTSKGVAALQKGMGGLAHTIGGEVGEMLSRVTEGFAQLGEEGHSAGAGLMVAGGAATAVGVMMMSMGSKEQAAQQQLKQAIVDTGGSWSDYSEHIEKAISGNEKYGHTAADTMAGIQKLTQATGDTGTALKDEAIVADLAAAKHESLSEASDQLAKVYGGSGRVLKEFGVTLEHTGDKTADAQKAIEELSGKLSGQAAAASDTFSGKMLAVKTHIEDVAAVWSQKAGPVLTVAGPVMMGFGAILESGVIGKATGAAKSLLGLSSAADVATAASTAEGAAAVEVAGAESAAAASTEAHGAAAEAAAGQMSMFTEAEVANTGATAENAAAQAVNAEATTAATASRAKGALGMAASTLGAAALVYGLDKGGHALSNYLERDNSFAHAMDNSKDAVSSFTQAMVDSGGVVGKQADETVTAQLQADGLADKAKRAGISMADLTTAVEGGNEGMKSLVDTWRASGKPSKDTITAMAMLHQEFGTAKDKAAELSSAEKALGTDSDTTAAATRRQTAAMVAQTSEASIVTATLLGMSGDVLSLAASQDALSGATQTLTGDMKTNGETFDGNTAKGLANKQALEAAVTAAENHAQAIYKSTGSTQEFSKALEDGKQAILDSAGDNDNLRGTIADLVTQYGLVPEKIMTKVDADTSAAQTSLSTVSMLLRNLDGSTARVGVTLSSVDRTIESAAGQAVGGPMQPGVNSVGEYGRETVSWGGPGTTPMVTANAQARAMGSGGGDTYVYVTVGGSVIAQQDLASQLQDQIAQNQRNLHGSGGVNIYGG
jgi:hypothetical protein